MRTDLSWTRRRALAALLAGPIGMQARSLHAAPAGVLDWPSLVTIEGQTLAPERWLGTPAVVVFWATYCAFCKQHNAHIDKLFRSVDADRLRILGVVVDADGAVARQTMQAQGYRFPVVQDDGRLRRRFTERRVIPMTCTVAADGRVQQCIPGEMAQDDVLDLARIARS